MREIIICGICLFCVAVIGKIIVYV